MTIALITGLKFEAKLANDLVKEADADTSVQVAGLGAPFAEKIVAEAKQAGAMGIVSFGVCGGLDPALVPGTVVLPETILAPDKISVDVAWRDRLLELLIDSYDITTGSLLTVKSAVETIEGKATLFKQTRACAVDMESGVLAREAAKHDLPFIVVRAVHDPASQAIPVGLRDIVNSNGQIDGWKLVKGLIFNWPGMKVLNQMSSNDQQARTNLEGLTRLALPGFSLDH